MLAYRKSLSNWLIFLFVLALFTGKCGAEVIDGVIIPEQKLIIDPYYTNLKFSDDFFQNFDFRAIRSNFDAAFENMTDGEFFRGDTGEYHQIFYRCTDEWGYWFMIFQQPTDLSLWWRTDPIGYYYYNLTTDGAIYPIKENSGLDEPSRISISFYSPETFITIGYDLWAKPPEGVIEQKLYECSDFFEQFGEVDPLEEDTVEGIN